MLALAKLRNHTQAWLSAGLELLYPDPITDVQTFPIEQPYCQQCCEMFPLSAITSTFRCSNCAGRAWALQRARAGFQFTGVVRDRLHAFKYNKEFHHLKHLKAWLQQAFERHYAHETWDGIVAVPLYKTRQEWRGFNQAHELAHALSKSSNIPLYPALERIKNTITQTHLRRSERLKNMRRAFALHPHADVRGKKLLLIDDVLTSGATGDACARVLVQKGAGEVCLLCIARG